MHGFAVSHDGEVAEFNAQCFNEHAFDHVLEQSADFFFVHERSFNIDLGEFGLAVSTQVFVTETFGDLVVAVKTRNHQQLFEQLRRLWQCEKVTIVHTARHQVITRTFGRALGQHGRFNIDKTIGVQKLAHRHRHFVAQHQVFLHVRTAQIEHAVSQACGLGQVVIIQLERRCDRRVQHHEFMAQHFNLAAF